MNIASRDAVKYKIPYDANNDADFLSLNGETHLAVLIISLPRFDKLVYAICPLLGIITTFAPAYASPLNPPTTSVTLFRWRWNDIAMECTHWLGPQGYGAVMTSPPQASAFLNTWYDVYQPVNYTHLKSAMGTEAEYQSMINTCHAAGVRVYADIVTNQMAGSSGIATDGSSWNATTLAYPDFSSYDFHSDCSITSADYNSSDRIAVWTCRLLGLPDLRTDSHYVQGQISAYLTKLITMGIDGFRFDAAKHMNPRDIFAFLQGAAKMTNAGEPLWVSQEIISDGGVVPSTYFVNGTVNEFHYVYAMKEMFRNQNGKNLAQLESIMGTPGHWGGSWFFIPSKNATVFVNNWDTERGTTTNPPSSLVASNHVSGVTNDTDRNKRFDLANILMLAWPYGNTVQIESGYIFTDNNAGPPAASPYDFAGNAQINQSWDFIHRWSDISNMVKFRTVTNGQGVDHFTTGTPNQIAFCRGRKGFLAINNDTIPWTAALQTALPPGRYCNIVHGLLNKAKTACTSDSVVIGNDGIAHVAIGPNDGSSVAAVALHVLDKVINE